MVKAASGCTCIPEGAESRCGITPAVAFIVGCMHEHVYRSAHCAAHDAEEEHWCTYCLRGADPHKCDLLMRPVSGRHYPHKLPEPSEMPDGRVLVHNPVFPPARRPGVRGSRFWLQAPGDAPLELCGCGWAPELGNHYITTADAANLRAAGQAALYT